MTVLHPPPRRRGGLPLFEMIVSTALIIFIMYILATAFEKGLDTFRMLKVAGDMQEKLRTAAVALRNDLVLPHFEDPGGKRFLVEQNAHQPGWLPPKKGDFRVDNGAS